MKKEINQRKKKNTSDFEKKKIINLNNFFMKNVFISLIGAVVLFAASVLFLIFIVTRPKIDESVKITIISMAATFILTTGKVLIDKLIDILVYLMKLLAEEQRGLNKKIGIEISEVDFLDPKDEKE